MNFVSKSENIFRNGFVLMLLLAGLAVGTAVAQHKSAPAAPKTSAPRAKAPAARPSTSRPATSHPSTTHSANGARPGTHTTPGGARAGTADRTSSLPNPTGDHGVTTYVVGGYDGTHYLPSVLATTDGTHFSTAASLPVPVRYPAVVADAGRLYAFGGQVPSPDAAAVATDDIQMIDPASHRAVVVGHLPQPLYGASAFLLGGNVYVAGGQVPGGATLTQIDAFVPSSGQVLDAGLLPQADAFAGYATLGAGRAAVGYLVGGEVAGQAGNRPGRRGLRFPPLGDLAAAEHLRGPRRAAGGRLSLLRHPPHRRPRQRPAARHEHPARHHLAVPVGHHAAAARRLLLPR